MASESIKSASEYGFGFFTELARPWEDSANFFWKLLRTHLLCVSMMRLWPGFNFLGIKFWGYNLGFNYVFEFLFTLVQILKIAYITLVRDLVKTASNKSKNFHEKLLFINLYHKKMIRTTREQVAHWSKQPTWI